MSSVVEEQQQKCPVQIISYDTPHTLTTTTPTHHPTPHTSTLCTFLIKIARMKGADVCGCGVGGGTLESS